ncbi:hypothetical protein DFQ28_007001 [Apophysomyces sp. BC1034]|nr:hypothetical protein DFQ30_009620 [Apophysomyces sp. BC1015]KAG0182208.1 hypothetical protein DFQ29_005263 [Apophysomyces sp. BC1021]KAG0192969.1 hypothetical protein DFQ28_007001 [Apophysomyces sp. BC1034]
MSQFYRSPCEKTNFSTLPTTKIRYPTQQRLLSSYKTLRQAVTSQDIDRETYGSSDTKITLETQPNPVDLHALFEQHYSGNRRESKYPSEREMDWKEIEVMFQHVPIVKDRHALYSHFAKLPISTIVRVLTPWLEQARVDDAAGRRVWRVIKDMSVFWDSQTRKVVMDTVDDERLCLHLFGLQLPEYRLRKDLDGLFAGMPTTASAGLRLKLYNTMLNVCLRQGQLEHVEKVILRMKQSVEPDAATFNIWIRAKLVVNDVAEAKVIYENMIESGVKPTVVTHNTFLKYACQNQSWDDMMAWLDRLEESTEANSITLRILLGAITEHKDDRVVSAFSRVANSCSFALPNTEPLLNPCITALLRHDRTDTALGILKRLFDHCDPKPPTICAFNLLIHSLMQKGECENAHEILWCMIQDDQLPNPDVVSFTTLIHGYMASPTLLNIEIVIKLYQQMRSQGISSNATLQSVLLNSLAKSEFADIQRATLLFELMVKEEDERNNCTAPPKSCDQPANLRQAAWLFKQITKADNRHGVSQSIMYNIMMDAYFIHHRDHKQAHAPYLLLKEASRKRILSTSTLNIWVRGLCLFQGNLTAAERIVDWFERQGIHMNERTAWYLVSGAYRKRRLDRAKHWLRVYEDKGHVIQGSGLSQLKTKIIEETSKVV